MSNTVSDKKSNAIFWVSISFLIALAILSIIVLSFRLYDYAKTDERTLVLKSNMDEELNVFSLEYNSKTGEVTVKSANGDKVVAPGTWVDYSVRLRNTDNVAIDYELITNTKFESEYKIPLEVRLIDPADNYLAGDEKTWIDIEELNNVSQSATLLKGQAVEYLFQWKWPYESGDDSYDTLLGDLATDQDIKVSVTFSVNATANTELKNNGGFFGSDADDNLITLISLIIMTAVTVLLFVYRRRLIRPSDSDSKKQ